MNSTAHETPPLCPICGGLAEKGFLLGSGRSFSFAWYPGEPTWWNRIKSGFSSAGVRVGEFGGFFGAWVEAVYCQSCQRAILEVTDFKKKYYPYLKE